MHRRIHFIVGFALAALYAVSAYGQARVDADYAEVLRRGDYVEAFGQGVRSEGESNYLAAVAKPADDSHKFFITVITSPGCPPCEKLKQDIRNKPELQAYINDVSPKQSWAIYNCYSITDETQTWRWENIKLTAFPTIIIQPPINKRYGDPSTVVFQKTGYKGGSAELAKQMGDQIRAYIAKQQTPAPNLRGAQNAAQYPYFEPNPTGGAKQVSPWKGPPPFVPPPRIEPNSPSPVGPDLIPDFVNPDRPAVPVTPVTPQPGVDDKPVATVVIDGLEAEAVITDTRFQRVLKALRNKHKNLTVEYSELSKNKDKFPTLTKADLPAIVVSEGGVIREAFTNLLLPLMQETPQPAAPAVAAESEGGPIRRAISNILQPWLSELPSPSDIAWYVSIFKGLTSYGPWAVGLGGAGLIGFYAVRRYRKQQGLPLVLSDAELQTFMDKLTALLNKPKTPA